MPLLGDIERMANEIILLRYLQALKDSGNKRSPHKADLKSAKNRKLSNFTEMHAHILAESNSQQRTTVRHENNQDDSHNNQGYIKNECATLDDLNHHFVQTKLMDELPDALPGPIMPVRSPRSRLEKAAPRGVIPLTSATSVVERILTHHQHLIDEQMHPQQNSRTISPQGELGKDGKHSQDPKKSIPGKVKARPPPTTTVLAKISETDSDDNDRSDDDEGSQGHSVNTFKNVFNALKFQQLGHKLAVQRAHIKSWEDETTSSTVNNTAVPTKKRESVVYSNSNAPVAVKKRASITHAQVPLATKKRVSVVHANSLVGSKKGNAHLKNVVKQSGGK